MSFSFLYVFELRKDAVHADLVSRTNKVYISMNFFKHSFLLPISQFERR